MTDTRATVQAQPAIFIGHGSPGNVMEDNTATAMWEQLGQELGKPKGIICVSAHWYTQGTAVTANQAPRTIHDFGGFPQVMYEMQYPAPGDPELAAKVVDLLSEEGARLDDSWGFDHGCWAILIKIFPEADIPVVQLSIDKTKGNDYHYRVGQKLAQLRGEGYLILGSGNIVHNLAVMDWRGRDKTYPWAQRFGDYIRQSITDNTPENAINYLHFGVDAEYSVPGPDHYLPLLYVMGARQPEDSVEFRSNYVEYGSLDMTSVIFQPGESAQLSGR
ncbi:4,5-DOPA dioxygenase extradiol [Halioxenophilus aromaticivorans]|uniref:4,5-DOPA dioxygenase extradiol n=1 Tax=Halioxenophilus aromaticivorans TaxID=1306992 RepID=A0AAV3U6L0_9ALTE